MLQRCTKTLEISTIFLYKNSRYFRAKVRCYSKDGKECKGIPKTLMEPKCKSVLITGGGEGIGFATAHQLLACKAKNVVLIGLNYSEGQQAVNTLNCAYGKGKAIFIRADVTKRNELEEAYDKAIQQYHKLDIIINSAGKFNEKNPKELIQNNLDGVIQSTDMGYEHLKKSRSGDQGLIINICGIQGLVPFPGGPVMAAADHGIVGYSRSLGDEYHTKETKVRVVALCVGTTKTKFYKDAEKKCRNEFFAKVLKRDLQKSKRQNTDSCGKAVVQVIKYGKTGGVYVIEGANFYRLEIPEWKCYKVLMSQFI